MNDPISASIDGQATIEDMATCENDGCCCLMGPGDRVRFALYVVGAIVFLGLIAYGFLA
ncbi:MAG: hypothetical protein ACOC9B_01675 [Chloroflexota bacterium]